MNSKINIEQIKRRIIDFLLLLAILFQDAGDFNILPIDLYKIFIVIIGLFYIVKIFKRKSIMLLDYKYIIVLVYILAITFIFNFDIQVLKNIMFLLFEFFVLFMYLNDNTSDNRIYKILYTAALILSVFGIVQLIAFNMNYAPLYDITLYGFRTNANYIRIGSPNSLYAEPSHLCAIIGSGIYLGLNKKNILNNNYIKTWKTLLIIAFGLLTKSILVYLSILIFLIPYFYITIGKKKFIKLLMILLILFATVLFVVRDSEFIERSLNKGYYIFHPDPYVLSGGTGWALTSNINIALRKVLDGYLLGTGLYSHENYYYYYIELLYGKVPYYINNQDAASLYIRSLSEFGIVGITGLAIFIISRLKLYLKYNRNKCFFVILLITESIRIGHYTNVLILMPFIYMIINNRKKVMEESKYEGKN